MSHGYAGYVRSFVNEDEDALVGKLVSAVQSTGVRDVGPEQVMAWRETIRLLRDQLSRPEFDDWYIILEYEIPRRSSRPDVILLSETTVFVIECKIGSDRYDTASREQSERYARDLRDFHEGSAGGRIVPILCATEATTVDRTTESTTTDPTFEPGVADLIRTNGSNLWKLLPKFNTPMGVTKDDPIVPREWLNSGYRAVPTIVEAAVDIYEGNGVREISHRYAHNLDETTQMLVNEIVTARQNGHHTICFVTGVPGAGKTLTGLDVVHDPELRRSNSLSGIFLSGNGPLVKVIRGALVQSQTSKCLSKRDAEREVSTFIQNVHVFLREYVENSNVPPPENVVVFDEAQRAWDDAQMLRKRKICASEPQLLFDVMERLADWAVIIALVGGGQEIFDGEAGLEEWGRALTKRKVSWRVVASPEALAGGASVAGHRLFESSILDNVDAVENAQAHLDVVVRSHRAQQWAEWVNEFLELNYDTARNKIPDIKEFPCFVTHDLENAKTWLRMHHTTIPEERIGLVATSQDQRLRADGLERSSAFRLNYPFDRWFLADDSDVRTSNMLEVAASEFECQGLELDWVGLCWGGDLLPETDESKWKYRKFRGSNWQSVKKEVERRYTLNRYRVLLTRARKGLVIWVPPGDQRDTTRNPEGFNRVFDALQKAGVQLLENNYPAEDLTAHQHNKNH